MTIPFATSKIIAQKHGFFGREGGVSSGIFSSLNCGQGSDDLVDDIRANRKHVSEVLGIPPDNLLSLHQIHSSDVIEIIDANWHENRPKADAMVTALPDIGLGIITADCAPVLFSDPVAKIIGAAHAGWKGALGNIAGNTVDAMVELGATRSNIRASIGPCISQEAYEVGQEFLEIFMDTDPQFNQFFVNGNTEKYHFDLAGFIKSQLSELGICDIDHINKCTYSLEDNYFSYRRMTHRQEPDYGRQLSVITNSTA